MPARIFIVFILSILSTISYAATVDDLTNEISDRVFGPVAKVISEELSRHMGFYTGAGDMITSLPSPFPGLELGAGLGFNMSYVFRLALQGDKTALTKAGSNKNSAAANRLSGAVALFPFPYDMLYGKMGLPGTPLDIGIRVGYIPLPMQTTDDGVSYYAHAFHLGAEGRYLFMQFLNGWIKLDGRVSLDYNGGALGLSYSNETQAFITNTLVGTNIASMGMDIAWNGLSLGGKVIASINIPVVGGVYSGLGVNVNLGQVSTRLFMIGTFRDLTASEFTLNFGQTVPDGYNLLDLRILFGFQLFFVSASLEYGILNRDLAINLYPLALAF